MKRLKLIVVALIGFIILSFQEQKELRFHFNMQQTNTILKGLSKLPYEESAVIIQTIQEQANKQLTDSTKNKW